jgi:DNA segregation ATPase FtsK/SpoIIIE, S-DNA-T family
MTERRPWRLDAAAFSLLAAGLLVSVAVFSLDPADRPGAVYPPTSVSRNLLGPAGAWLAFALTDALGVAVYVLLASWFVLVVLLFLRRSWLRWSLRLTGWLLLIPCAAVIADLAGINRGGGPPAGPGGSLGAWLALWLQARLPPIGRLLVLAALLTVGLFLALDRALLQLLTALGRTVRVVGRTVAGWLPRFRLRSASLPARTAERMSRAVAEEESEAPPKKKTAEAAAGPRTIPIFHHAAPQLADPAVLSERQRFADFELPPLTLLEDSKPVSYNARDQQLRDRAALLEKTFTDFGLNVRVVGINTGPVITQFEVALQTGLRVHKVTRLTDDIALNLSVPSVRILAPIPGKNTVGIEIPNENRANVGLKEVILASTAKLAKFKVPLFLGCDGEGRPLVYDLADMPHLLIAGSTGTGKSVCVNAIVLSMLMTRRPDDLKMIMIDPKVVELSEYGKIPHLLHPVVSDMKKAEAILAWAVDKMEERYALLSRAGVRNIASFNELGADEVLRRIEPPAEERDQVPTRLPYIVIFIDEMADLMMMLKKEVEGHIIRLAQKSRAAGIHLVVATQKPTVDVITGLIKSNLPARICFKVTNKSDSRVVLDEMGADKLLGKGDMLFLQPGTSNLIRAQGSFASDAEIQGVVRHLECEPCYDPELMTLETSARGAADLADRVRSRDELYETAIEVVLREGRGSVSLLQRILQIGYGRAARLIDYMAEDGIVGAYNGSNAREVLYTPDQWADLKKSSVRPA